MIAETTPAHVRATRSPDRAKPLVDPAAPGRAVDHRSIERAIREILFAIGDDPDREGLADTPARVARAYAEIFQGLCEDPGEHLSRVFNQPCDEPVIVTNIDFHSVCEHHLLPFHGRAHVAYLPANGRVVGLSKVARTVQVYARRPQIQERMTNQIADAMERHLQPAGVAVLIEAEHLCMKMRGVKTHCSSMQTRALRGTYKHDPNARSEVLTALHDAARKPK